MKVVMLAPEPPYPLQGGGAYRTASLLHYFARFAEVDLIQFSETGQPALLPAGLVRHQHVIPLPPHSKGTLARYLRNARRALQGVPPLIDRLAGFSAQVEKALGSEHYDLGIVEHFWCAPYLDQMRRHATHTLLDLHNIESVLDARCAEWSSGLLRAGHQRFARAYRICEAALLPEYSLVLTASTHDAELAQSIAPTANIAVYPNALPLTLAPTPPEQNRLVFSANFEYHPNIDAVQFLLRDIWPAVRQAHPGLELCLVGRGHASVRIYTAGADGVQVTGPVDDALAEIAQAKIVLAPLRIGSGTRVKILEAWAAARPVIATPLAAEGLDVRDQENIILAHDVPLIISSIGRLLGNPEERKRLGTAGRHTFEHKYSWPAAWQGLELTLDKLGLSRLGGYTGSN
jgi:glycosyltransferase involved in cell wall biosynthesis